MHLSYCTPDGTGTGTFTSLGRFGTMNARESDFPTTKTQTVFSHIRKGNGRREPTRHPTFQCCKRETETDRFFLFCTLVETNSCREGRRCRPATRLSDCAPRVPLTVCHVNQKKKKVHTTLSNACTITAPGVATCALPVPDRRDGPPLIPLPCMMHRRLCDFYSSLVEDSTRRHAQPFPAWLQKRGKF